MEKGRKKWSTVSVHSEYIETLAELKEKHKRSYTSMVEMLIDRAVADPGLLMPMGAESAQAGDRPCEARD